MKKNRAILEAAQPLFGTYGLSKVTTEDIARAAKVSKATIYKHFSNKQEILRDIVRYELDELLFRIRAAVDKETTVENKLRAYLLTKIGTVRALINLHRVTKETMAENWDHSESLRLEFVAKEIGLTSEILQKGIDDKELELADVNVTSHLMVTSLKALENPWALTQLQLTLEEQVQFMLDIILNGLRSRN